MNKKSYSCITLKICVINKIHRINFFYCYFNNIVIQQRMQIFLYSLIYEQVKFRESMISWLLVSNLFSKMSSIIFLKNNE